MSGLLPPPGRNRRAVLAGGAVVVATWVVLRGLPTLLNVVSTAEAQLHELAFDLARDRAEVEYGQRLVREGTELQDAVVGLAPDLLSGATSAEATDDLTNRISLGAGNGGARLSAIVPVQDSARAGWLRRAGVRVTLEGDIGGIVSTLRHLAAGPALRLDSLHVAATQADEASELLKADFIVLGWYLERQVPAPSGSTPTGGL